MSVIDELDLSGIDPRACALAKKERELKAKARAAAKSYRSHLSDTWGTLGLLVAKLSFDAGRGRPPTSEAGQLDWARALVDDAELGRQVRERLGMAEPLSVEERSSLLSRLFSQEAPSVQATSFQGGPSGF